MNQDESSAALPHLVLLRLSGEIATKAPATRARFERRLLRNLRDALASERIDARVVRTRSRIFVHAADLGAAAVLARVAGIQSVSLSHPQPAQTLAEVVERGVALYRQAVAGRRFAVRARRVGERREIALSARELESALGAALLPGAAGVDLDDAEVTVHVELFQRQAHFFAERMPGPGGLPAGVEGRAVALISGGFDSAVAAWQLLRRGVALDYAFCNLGGAAHRLGVLRVAKVIADRWSYGTRPKLYGIDFEELSQALRARTDPRYWQVLLKRLMVRAAAEVARQRGASALVTGESVGQVSSQTLQNLAVISEATPVPILRPLVGMNKEEIIEQARRIGTAELSAVVNEYCAMVPRRPATSATLGAIREQEEKLDAAVFERALARRESLDLRRLAVGELGIPALETREIPAGATVIDLRSRTAFRDWHWPGAVHLDYEQALAAYASFASEPTYVAYCEFGLKSAHLAELMRRAGLRAWHVPGGWKTLRERVPERDGPVAT